MSITHQTTSAAISSLINPRSVAIVGANDNLGTFNGGPVHNLLRHGYQGPVYPVNPTRQEVQGLRCYRSIADIGKTIDSVVVVVRADRALVALQDAAEAGARSAIVVSSGLGEGASGSEGASRRKQVADLLETSGMALLGPNSIGLMNLFDNYVPRANTNHLPSANVATGPIALISQSGAANNIVFNRAQANGVRIGLTAATGVQLGIDLWDLTEYAIHDERIDIVVMVAEDLGSAERFVPVLQRASDLGKAVVLLKTGRTEAGSAAAATHSGALAGDWKLEQALLHELGVAIVHDLDELWEVASLFRWWGCAPKPDLTLGAIALSGGEGTLVADLATDAGFELPDLSDRFADTAATHLPLAGIGNPFDPSGDILSRPEAIPPVFDSFVRDNGFDVHLCAVHMQSAALLSQPLKTLSVEGKRVAVSWWSAPGLTDDLPALTGSFAGPVFTGSHRFVTALQTWAEASRSKSHQSGSSDSQPFHDVVREPLELDGVPSYFEARVMLERIGIQFASAELVTSQTDAIEAAERLGFPVVMKADVSSETHKAASGLIELGVSTPLHVRAAYDRLAARGHGSVVVEESAVGVVQLFAGIAVDPNNGPALLFGSGGSATEFLDDVAVLPCQFVTPSSVRRLISRTRIGRFVATSHPDLVPVLLDQLLALGLTGQSGNVSVDINPLVLRLNPPRIEAIDARIVGVTK